MWQKNQKEKFSDHDYGWEVAFPTLDPAVVMVGLGTAAFFVVVPLGWAAKASEDEAGIGSEDEEDAWIPSVLVDTMTAFALLSRIAAGGSEDLGGDCFLAGCCSLSVDGNRNKMKFESRSIYVI